MEQNNIYLNMTFYLWDNNVYTQYLQLHVNKIFYFSSSLQMQHNYGGLTLFYQVQHTLME